VALWNLNKLKEAIDCYSEAIKLDPKYTEAWSNKGIHLNLS